MPGMRDKQAKDMENYQEIFKKGGKG